MLFSPRKFSSILPVLLHVTQKVKLQQPKNDYVLYARQFDVLRDDDPIRFETITRFNVVMYL